MIVVSYEKELREAFKAGQHSMLPQLLKSKHGADVIAWSKDIPATYEEWIASRSNMPQIARG